MPKNLLIKLMLVIIILLLAMTLHSLRRIERQLLSIDQYDVMKIDNRDVLVTTIPKMNVIVLRFGSDDICGLMKKGESS